MGSAAADLTRYSSLTGRGDMNLDIDEHARLLAAANRGGGLASMGLTEKDRIDLYVQYYRNILLKIDL